MIAKSWLSRCWQWQIGGCVALVGVLCVGVSDRVKAQIVPDNTLGAESSVVTPDVIKGIPSNRIEGGATRGANLFHSFQEFNVGEGRGAYFANPTGIENILTRVTGGNPSNIFGRLGVLGEANLFLLNPRGIVFGYNASLDIQGSFVATTAERIPLGDSGYFSAAQPQTSSLLSVSPGALFFSELANQATAIINQGNLSTGKHLTLSAGNLDLQGQLLSGGDLTLQAQDTVKVRDSPTTPFLARTGGNLTIVGNGGIDILALNHPTQTPFASGGNLSLISDGIISLDARFSSGGSFSIKSVSGELANFVSYYDPIISANGNVDVAANYTGASLLVEATGNIRFEGNINITRPDTSGLPAGPDTATLSTSSALIMRSGQSTLDYGGVNAGAFPAYRPGNAPSGITIGGNVTLEPFNGAGGIVNLSAALGNVSTQGITTTGGAINIDSAGSITNNGQTLNTTNDCKDKKCSDHTPVRDFPIRTPPPGVTIPLTASDAVEQTIFNVLENQIDTDSLIANSCIVRRNQPTQGSFTITGTGGLPQRPGDAQMSSYPTVDIETLPSDDTPTNTNPNRPWQKGDPIVEPQGVYRLPNGNLVMSRECS